MHVFKRLFDTCCAAGLLLAVGACSGSAKPAGMGPVSGTGAANSGASGLNGAAISGQADGGAGTGPSAGGTTGGGSGGGADAGAAIDDDAGLPPPADGLPPPADGLPPPADSVGAGCQPGRRTVVHAPSGAAMGNGSYQPCLMNTGHSTGESTIVVTNDGTIIRSVVLKPPGVVVSTDRGATWELRKLPDDTQLFIGAGFHDPVTDRYFYTALGAGPVYGTDDAGKTWLTGTVNYGFLQDWPKMFSGPPTNPREGSPSNLYYCNWTFGFAEIRCFKSIDGGARFEPTSDKPVDVSQTCPVADDNNFGRVHGIGVVDPHDGTLYLPVMDCGQLWLLVSTDEGATWSRRDVPIAKTVRQSTAGKAQESDPALEKQKQSGHDNIAGPQGSALVHSQVLAMESSGRFNLVWVDERDFLVHMASSEDRGLTWSKDIVVSAPGVTQTTEPAIVVAADGRLGLSYYGTEDDYTWTGYLAIIDDAARPAKTIQSTAVTLPGEPLMSHPCCWANGLAEWTSVAFAPDGSLWAGFQNYVDTGDPFGMVARLVPLR